MKNIEKHIFKQYWAKKKVEEVVEPIEDENAEPDMLHVEENKQEEVEEDGE